MYFSLFNGVFCLSFFCYALLCVHPNLQRSWRGIESWLLCYYCYRCIVTINVLLLFLTVLRVGLQYVVLVFPDHTHYCFGRGPLGDATYQIFWLESLWFPTGRFFLMFSYIGVCKTWDPWTDLCLAQGHNLNKLGKGSLGDATYQILCSSPYGFRQEFCSCFLCISLCKTCNPPVGPKWYNWHKLGSCLLGDATYPISGL